MTFRNYFHLRCCPVFLETDSLRYFHTACSELDVMVKLYMVGGNPMEKGVANDATGRNEVSFASFCWWW